MRLKKRRNVSVNSRAGFWWSGIVCQSDESYGSRSENEGRTFPPGRGAAAVRSAARQFRGRDGRSRRAGRDRSDEPDSTYELYGDTDRASAALVNDLKQRGLLDDTLVIWGGEFGRTPYAQGKSGRA